MNSSSQPILPKITKMESDRMNKAQNIFKNISQERFISLMTSRDNVFSDCIS